MVRSVPGGTGYCPRDDARLRLGDCRSAGSRVAASWLALLGGQPTGVQQGRSAGLLIFHCPVIATSKESAEPAALRPQLCGHWQRPRLSVGDRCRAMPRAGRRHGGAWRTAFRYLRCGRIVRNVDFHGYVLYTIRTSTIMMNPPSLGRQLHHATGRGLPWRMQRGGGRCSWRPSWWPCPSWRVAQPGQPSSCHPRRRPSAVPGLRERRMGDPAAQPTRPGRPG
jgi:hypothetical protein